MPEQKPFIVEMLHEDTDIHLQLGENNPPSVKPGSTVRWEFATAHLAKYWAAALYFDAAVIDGKPCYGPFAELTQTIDGDKLVIEGRTEPDSQGGYGYYAALYKGVAKEDMPGEEREMTIVCSSKQTLKVTGEPENVQPPQPPDPDYVYELIVWTDDETSLEVQSPVTPVLGDKIHVEWDFKEAFDLLKKKAEGDFPLIVFYKCRSTATSETNVCYGPFEAISYQPGKVIGKGRREYQGHFHYEAILISSKHHSVKFVSSGDPQLDNEGTG